MLLERFIPENYVIFIMNYICFFQIILIAQYLCGAHLNLNNRNLLRCAIWGGLAVFIVSLFVTEDFIFTISFITICFTTVLILSYKRVTDFFLCILAFFLYIALTTAPVALLDFILPISNNDTFYIGSLELHLFSLSLDILIVSLLFLLHFISQKYQIVLHLSLREWMLSFVLFFYSLIIILFAKLIHESQPDAWIATLWMIILPCAFIAGIGYYIYTIAESRIRFYRENIMRTQTAYLTTQLQSLQTLKDKEDDIQKMRHDLKKHLAVIEELYATGHYDMVKDYSSQLNLNFNPGADQPVSGNKIADIILDTRRKEAEARGISFTYEGSLSGLSTLSEPDICSLLANAYDNALEACMGQSNAYISTRANTTRHFLSIEICNSVSKKAHIHGNHINTTKPDKRNHGYGIEIMQQIAQKYHGKCTMTCNQTEFKLSIQLHI